MCYLGHFSQNAGLVSSKRHRFNSGGVTVREGPEGLAIVCSCTHLWKDLLTTEKPQLVPGKDLRFRTTLESK